MFLGPLARLAANRFPNQEIMVMKTTLFLLCFLCATAAFGQSYVGSILNNQPQMLQIPGHPEHASQQSLALEQNLLGRSDFVHARGERPLWEVAPASVMTPLGDVARDLRKEHAAAKKAEVVWEN